MANSAMPLDKPHSAAQVPVDLAVLVRAIRFVETWGLEPETVPEQNVVRPAKAWLVVLTNALKSKLVDRLALTLAQERGPIAPKAAVPIGFWAQEPSTNKIVGGKKEQDRIATPVPGSVRVMVAVRLADLAAISANLLATARAIPPAKEE